MITLVRPWKAYGLMLVPLGKVLWLDKHKLASLWRMSKCMLIRMVFSHRWMVGKVVYSLVMMYVYAHKHQEMMACVVLTLLLQGYLITKCGSGCRNPQSYDNGFMVMIYGHGLWSWFLVMMYGCLVWAMVYFGCHCAAEMLPNFCQEIGIMIFSWLIHACFGVSCGRGVFLYGRLGKWRLRPCMLFVLWICGLHTK